MATRASLTSARPLAKLHRHLLCPSNQITDRRLGTMTTGMLRAGAGAVVVMVLVVIMGIWLMVVMVALNVLTESR